MHKKHRAIGLISGGLDSILAVKIVLEQGIEVIGVCFTSPFFNNSQYAKSVVEKLGIELKIVNFGNDYIDIVKNPIHGYGKNLNPCIDCHTYMLKHAKKLIDEFNAEEKNYKESRKTGDSFLLDSWSPYKNSIFVFTGEVLNERPMSQNQNALKMIEKESGLQGMLLRPLSAQLLEPTIPETEGIINRTKLSKISGRSRKPQLELAKKYGITDFPQPAGGCLLTEPNFCIRLKDIFNHNQYSLPDLELLKIGRHFRVESAKIVVGRNENENKLLLNIASESDFNKSSPYRTSESDSSLLKERPYRSKDTDIILEPAETVGPVVLVRNYKDKEKVVPVAAGLCARYSDKGDSNLVKIKINDIIIDAEPISESSINKLRI